MDPLARFFTHAPDVKILAIGQLPAPGEDGFPDTIITQSLTERDRLSYVNEEAGYFFGRQMSQDELNEVIPNFSESDHPDRAKWLERVVGWALEHEDLFAKPYEPSKDEPREDEVRWFSAYRIELPSTWGGTSTSPEVEMTILLSQSGRTQAAETTGLVA